MAVPTPTWPEQPQAEVRGEDQVFWLEIRRHHIGIASAIARKLGLRRCPQCGHDLRPGGGNK